MRARPPTPTLAAMTTSTLPRVHPRDRSRSRLLTRAFVRLTVADLAYFTAAGIAVYALPFYVTGPVGSDSAGAGLAFGAFAVSALVLRPFAGRLADTCGRRPLLVGGALLCAVVMCATAVVDTLPAVVALRLVLGVAEAAFFVASIAALADLAPPDRLGEALSYNSLGLYLGLALGPPLGETAVRTVGFDGAWCIAAGLALLAAAVASGVGETRAVMIGTSGPGRLVHRPAIAPGLGFLASVIGMSALLAFASLQADRVGLTTTSLPLLVYGGVVVGCRIVFAKIPDRLAPLHLGAAALASIAAGLTVTAVWNTPFGLVAGTAVTALGVTFSTPAFFATIFATAGPAERGAASGTASAFIDLGLGGGPIVLGCVAAAADIPIAFGAAAAVALAGSLWSLSLARVRA
jgi:predicted MFS family arabinose efflux permease